MELERREFLALAAGALTYSLATDAAWAQTNKVEVQWLGQASTKITTPTGKVIVIDPFLTQNPKTPPQHKNLDALGKVDVILVTHGHGDHVGDVRELAARTGAKVLGPAGLIATMIGGLAFVGLHLTEWHHLIDEGATLWKNPWGTPLFGATFFGITGLHMTHVMIGVIYMGIIAGGFGRGKFTPEDVEVSGLYWHFVDLVWMFVFPMIYLMSVKY